MTTSNVSWVRGLKLTGAVAFNWGLIHFSCAASIFLTLLPLEHHIPQMHLKVILVNILADVIFVQGLLALGTSSRLLQTGHVAQYLKPTRPLNPWSDLKPQLNPQNGEFP